MLKPYMEQAGGGVPPHGEARGRHQIIDSIVSKQWRLCAANRKESRQPLAESWRLSPCSRIAEIFGPEGGGKTTLAQHIVAEAQKLGGTAVYIDMEHAVDLAYMQACGVDTSAVCFSQQFPLWSS
jgi:hypothetical protein